MIKIIIIFLLCFFSIKLPLTNVGLEIAFILTAVLFGVYNFFLEEKHLLYDIIGLVVFIGIFILFSDYSKYENIGFAIIAFVYILNIIKNQASQ